MVYKHTVHESAEYDIQDAIVHYSNISLQLVQELIKELNKTICEIKKHPFIFQKISKRYYKANLSRFPYKIIYEIRSAQITITAFAHHKRKPNYWKNRK